MKKKLDRKEIIDSLINMNGFVNEIYNSIDDQTIYEKIIKREYDKIYSEFINFNGLKINEMKKFVKLLSKFITDSSYDEDKIPAVFDLVLLTNLVSKNSQVLFIDEIQLKSIISVFYECEILPSSYKKYLSILLDNKVQESLKYTDKGQNIFFVILENIDFDSPTSKVVDDIVLLLDREKNDDEKSELFNNDFSFNNIYNTIYEQMEFFNDFCNGEVYSKEQFIKLKQVLKFNHLPLEKQEDFIECVKKINKYYDNVIDKIRIILSIIGIYSSKINSKVITPEFNKNRSRR